MSTPQHAAAPNARFESSAEFYRNSAYSEFSQSHRFGGSLGVTMMKVDQEPIDLIDAPVPELVFCRVDTDGREILLDLGDGPVRSPHIHGSLTVYPADNAARTRVLDGHTVTVLSFPVQLLLPGMKNAGITADATAFGDYLGRMRPAPAASQIMDRMWRIMQSPDPLDHLLLDGLSLEFIADVAGATELSPVGCASPEDVRIARVVNYLEAHIGEALTVTELASVACLSPGHFSRTFKATTGEAVWSYVQRRRCERARDMLLGTREPIAHIAYVCGFSNQAHMTRQLSACFGATPGAIRRSA